ncbi:MAG: hypothetical protein KGD65_13855 [Candidatus Lokiarchaeota archaeon]|nr:hypothetical protein [Candidatus Lokiarchaeota archaeon]
MKKKSKVTKALIAVLFLIGIITIVTPVLAAESNHVLVRAKGDDLDIAGATTSIKAMIEYDNGIPSVAQVEFQTKIYDESGKKIYSMKGELKDGLVISDIFQFYCTVREVMWINLWFVMGKGVIKTTDTDLEIEYRGGTVTLPNTEGQYKNVTIWMMVNPKGEYLLGEDPEVYIWPEGGWASAIILVDEIPTVGVVTYLTKYMEI